jgi:hypothetical protein
MKRDNHYTKPVLQKSIVEMTVSPNGREKGCKGGKGGEFEVTNAEFVSSVFPCLPEASFAAVCQKSGDPGVRKWLCRRADKRTESLSVANNNYINCSTFYPGDDGSFKARKTQFAACHFLMLDDLGTKALFGRLKGFKLSWLIETSPGNYQGGIILTDPITEGAVAIRLLNAIIDVGASGPLSRWTRLPAAVNGKPKYIDESGEPFQCRLVEYRPDARYTPQEIVDGLKLELAPAGRPNKSKASSGENGTLGIGSDVGDVLTPRTTENQVVAALKARGLYKSLLGSGQHDITCPWVHEHTDALDTGVDYFEPDELHPLGGFFEVVLIVCTA